MDKHLALHKIDLRWRAGQQVRRNVQHAAWAQAARVGHGIVLLQQRPLLWRVQVVLGQAL